MAKLVIHPPARQDLVEITRYGAGRWGRDAAREYARSFEETFALLRRYPLTGRERPELASGLRSRRHRTHIIYYTATRLEVTVVRILHAAADPAAAFEDE